MKPAPRLTGVHLALLFASASALIAWRAQITWRQHRTLAAETQDLEAALATLSGESLSGEFLSGESPRAVVARGVSEVLRPEALRPEVLRPVHAVPPVLATTLPAATLPTAALAAPDTESPSVDAAASIPPDPTHRPPFLVLTPSRPPPAVRAILLTPGPSRTLLAAGEATLVACEEGERCGSWEVVHIEADRVWLQTLTPPQCVVILSRSLTP